MPLFLYICFMGKNKYIETPENLYKLFEDYKKEVKNNPKDKEIKGR